MSEGIWLFCFCMCFGINVAQKQMCQISDHGLLASCQVTVYLADVNRISYNGPAIWGGCVTRRQHRAESWFFSREVVTVQGGYGALFAVMVQILLRAGAIAVQA